MMNDASDRVGRLKPAHSSPALLAMLGAVAVTAGLKAFQAWPARRSSASTRKREALIAYLRDHLTGSDAAIRVVHRLRSTHHGTDGTLFHRLFQEFQEDRSVVYALLAQLGASERSLKRAAGVVSGTVLSVTAGGEPGELSLFRTLEALAIGVQGKRCMWRALQNLSPVPSTLDGLNFVELEAKAVRQWEAIEERRQALVAQTFSVAALRAK